jgi:hypothetical protein
MGMFGLLSYVICCIRRQVRQAVAGAVTANSSKSVVNTGMPIANSVPMARIGRDGKSSIVHGVLVPPGQQYGAQRRQNMPCERQALLDGVTGF